MAASSGGDGPERNAGARLALVVSLLGALVGIVGVAYGVFRALHARSAGTSVGGDLLIGALGAVLMLLCVRWTMHAEHRLRRRDPVAASYSPAASSVLTSLAVGHRSGRRYAPLSITGFLALWIVLLGVCVTLTLFAERGAAKSAYTQQHGTVVTATVVSTDDVWHAQRYGGYYTSQIDVALKTPVYGTSTTTVYDPVEYSGAVDVPLSVVIDPQDPSYAELPGQPMNTRTGWILLTGLDVALLVLAGAGLAARLGYARHRKTYALDFDGSAAHHGMATGMPAYGGFGPVGPDGFAMPSGAASASGYSPTGGANGYGPVPSHDATNVFGSANGGGAGTRLPDGFEPALGGVTTAYVPVGGIAPPGGFVAPGSPAATAGFTSAAVPVAVAVEDPASAAPSTSLAGAASAPGAATAPFSSGAAGPSSSGAASPSSSGAAGPGAVAPLGPIDAAGVPAGSSPTLAASPAPPVHPPAWHPDPFERFQLRYWDGTSWTQWVSDGSGSTSTDPLTPSAS